MVIISESEKRAKPRYGSTLFQYSIIYVIVTLIVLVFLNIYSSGTSQKLFYQNKEVSMIEKCQLAAAEIANLEVLNPSTASTAVSQMGALRVTRLIITNQSGLTMYDSLGESGLNTYVILPEVVSAMEGNDVFHWEYHDGAMRSHAATPVYSYGTLIGCVYMMEYDLNQGTLIQSLQKNVFTITLILELAVVIFSIVFAFAYSKRLRQILTSIRTIREGDYSHKVIMGGRDELTVLGEEFNDLTDKLQTSENKRHQFVSDASH